ncbi:MAG: hypothetical protein RIG67_18710 [Rhodospirillales bacterium]
MIKVGDREFSVGAIRESLYGDALSEQTRKAGRNLLVISGITFFIHAYSITAKPSAILPLDFSNNPEALHTFFALINLIMLCAFIIRLINDLMRVNELWVETRKFIELEKIHNHGEQVRRFESDLYEEHENRSGPDPYPDPWWEIYIEKREEAEKRISILEEKIGDRRLVALFWKFRLTLSAGMPLLAGMIATYHSSPNLGRFADKLAGL